MDAEVPRGTTILPPIAVVHFDGACQPPRGGGVAAYGFTIEGAMEHEDCGLAVRPGSPHATNNVAEYAGAIAALEWLRRQGFQGAVEVYGDSQLVVRQMNGEYEVRAEHLKAYHELLGKLASGFAASRFIWVPREENARADELSKLAVEAEAERLRDPPARVALD
jgi:ribonuclease HI